MIYVGCIVWTYCIYTTCLSTCIYIYACICIRKTYRPGRRDTKTDTPTGLYMGSCLVQPSGVGCMQVPREVGLIAALNVNQNVRPHSGGNRCVHTVAGLRCTGLALFETICKGRRLGSTTIIGTRCEATSSPVTDTSRVGQVGGHRETLVQ